LCLYLELVSLAVEIVFKSNEGSVLDRARSLHLYGSNEHTKVILSPAAVASATILTRDQVNVYIDRSKSPRLGDPH
jgi:hypothetical protein